MSGAMNVDSTAAAASAESTPTPSMVAERPVTTVPEGARADVQAMLDQAMAAFKIELRSEIGKEFDTAMNINFTSLNQAMSDTHLQMKGYVDTSSVELIAKFDKIFNDKTTAIETQIKALEENIKTAVNKMGQNNGGVKEFFIGDDGNQIRRDPFYKAYRITEQADKWNESNKGKFEDFRRLALRFFGSGPEGITTMLKYAVKQQESIDLSAKDPTTDKFKHQTLLDEVPDAAKLDKLLYNELMSMITGDVAKSLYITTNLKESGVEMWRRMHKNNDPKTYQTVDGHMRTVTTLTATRCRGLNDLRERLEKYDVAVHKYLEAGGEAMSEVMKRHHLINITPEKLFELWQVQPGFMSWDSQTIKTRMLDMINVNYVFGVENGTRHGLYDLGCQPCGGTEAQPNHNWHGCEGNCSHSA